MPVPVKFTAVVGEPLHTVALAGGVTVGVGFTVIEKFCAVPRQVSAAGVTVIVATKGDDVELTAVNDPMLPVPLAASPIEVGLFVQV